MDNRRTADSTDQKFTWIIENFSKLSAKKLYSQTFIVGGYPWRILMFPNGNKVDHLSLYLDAADSASLSPDWSRNATFSLAVTNQINGVWTIKRETIHKFNAAESDWGFTNFMPLSELRGRGRGYLMQDKCIIDAKICIPQSENENKVDQAAAFTASLNSVAQAGRMEVEAPHEENQAALVLPQPAVSSLPTELPSTPTGELKDFRGLGKIEEVFLPLLEDVCNQHPSLIECQQKRSRQFVEWAFTALGRVLHFLKTKRVKDMNDEACMDLQILWEELETFKFDLSWLEPHVQSALGMKNYLEREMQLKRLREHVAALEMEKKQLEAKLVPLEADLGMTRNDLVQAEEGFEERDMDSELGYGRP